ncbi:MAG TPA: serpin family protein [Pirellulales bacterium]|nr:serpin family protein [Pirellulales bacterium]
MKMWQKPSHRSVAILWRLVCITAATATLGCSGDRAVEVSKDNELLGIATGEDDETASPDIPLRTIAAGRSDQESLVLANSDFAFDLYGRLRGRRGNLVFAPYIISRALAMCYAGARGGTETEMTRCSRLPFGQGRMHAAFRELNVSLNSTPKKQGITLLQANRLWADESLQVDSGYLDLTREQYEAELGRVALASHPDEACREINGWVRQRTHDKIGDVVSSETVSDARLLLVCSIYFKATWAQPFFDTQTKPAPFHTQAGQVVEVPMMNYDDIVEAFRLSETPTMQMLELRYDTPSGRDGDYCMLVLLPKRRDGLHSLERELTTDNVNEWVKGLKTDHIEVYLPRFGVKTQFQLAHVLAEMGMQSAFDPQSADFTGISEDENLYLTNAVHAAVIDVDEKGTEAAATQLFAYGAEDDSEPKVFRADHPFVFLIRHNPTGTILFIGRVVNPKGM